MPVTSCTKCPTLIPLGQSRCAKHRPKVTKTSSTQRGYNYQHEQLRKQWAPLVKTGTVNCARCNTPIKPTDKWDLGHHDRDRTRYVGPEHASCNRGRRKVPTPTI